jgi:antitoxin CptB
VAAALSVDELETDGQVLRLRWQCRRGMLELDLLLNRFLDLRFVGLSIAERADFERLLGYQDQILQDWLIGQAVPADPSLAHLVVAIRGCMLEEGSRA